MTDQAAVVFVLRALFPTWDIGCERGVWVAYGARIIRASTVDLLVEAIYQVDPEAVRSAAELFSEDFDD